MAREKIATDRNPLAAAAALEKAESNPAFRKKLYLIGTIALEEAERNPAFKEELYASLDSFLAEKEDRTLFDLPPRENENKPAPAAEKGNESA